MSGCFQAISGTSRRRSGGMLRILASSTLPSRRTVSGAVAPRGIFPHALLSMPPNLWDVGNMRKRPKFTSIRLWPTALPQSCQIRPAGACSAASGSWYRSLRPRPPAPRESCSGCCARRGLLQAGGEGRVASGSLAGLPEALPGGDRLGPISLHVTRMSARAARRAFRLLQAMSYEMAARVAPEGRARRAVLALQPSTVGARSAGRCRGGAGPAPGGRPRASSAQSPPACPRNELAGARRTGARRPLRAS